MAKKCACIRKDFDFDLIGSKCSDIVYVDHSTFQEGPDYSDFPTYTLSIEDPNGSVTSHQVTKGIPLHLNFGKCVVPGVYTFSADSCTEKFYKKAVITCTLWCGYARVAAKLGKAVDSVTLRSIRERIESAEGSASNDFLTAAAHINAAERLIERYDCGCAC